MLSFNFITVTLTSVHCHICYFTYEYSPSWTNILYYLYPKFNVEFQFVFLLLCVDCCITMGNATSLVY